MPPATEPPITQSSEQQAEPGGSHSQPPSKDPTHNTSNQDSQNNFECHICLDTVQSPVVTTCGHLYCWACLDRWMCSRNSNAKACPLCKAMLTLDRIIPVYTKGNTVDPRLKRASQPYQPNRMFANHINFGVFPFAHINLQDGTPQNDGLTSRIFLMIATLVLISIMLY